MLAESPTDALWPSRGTVSLPEAPMAYQESPESPIYCSASQVLPGSSSLPYTLKCLGKKLATPRRLNIQLVEGPFSIVNAV